MFHCISGNNSHLTSIPHHHHTYPTTPNPLNTATNSTQNSGASGGQNNPPQQQQTVPHHQITLSPSLSNPFSSWYSSNSLGSYYNAIGFSRNDMKHVFPDLRIQLVDQLKTLDTRLETQVQLTSEIQEFFKKRAEVELETSRALEKLAKNLNTRHKEIKAKRDSSSSSTSSTHQPSSLSTPLLLINQQANPPQQLLQPWTIFNSQSSLSVCWQQLINDTKIQSQNHAILADIYSTEITQRLQFVSDDLQRIYKQCREIGLEAHEELLKVLHELHTSMKTYHTYQTETRIAEAKLKLVEAQKCKLETQIPKEKLEKSKKYKQVEKEVQKRLHKFTDARFKSQKAKNEYILCMDAANAAVQKYFMEDLSDLIDCMDLGFYECVTRSLNMYVSSQDQIRKSLSQNMECMSRCISGLDARLDKQKFLESHNSVFALPKKFEFVLPTYPNNKNTASIAEEDFTPDPSEIETSGFIRQELEQRLFQLHKRLETLRMESDELWKTLETAENSLLEMITAKDYDTCAFFVERGNKNNQNEAMGQKIRSDKQETDEFHLNKFRDYMLTMNRISRLQSKYEHIRRSLKSTDPTGQLPSTSAAAALAASNRHYNRRKRIGQIQKFTNTRLFGGSIEEYLEKTNQEIPLIMKSCIRVINLYGLHHQGIFRVSGSQLEINNFKEAFEKGEDPLADVTDASDINSVAGVLKLYLRELREPLFPICYFEQFMELAQLDSNTVFIGRMRDLVKSLPRAVFIVLRYLFAFLNHLSEYSDENMMDPYNLAICFGPTLVLVPDKDQVQFQNLVNELIKNVILFHDEIFVDVSDGLRYEKYQSADDGEVEEESNKKSLVHESCSPVLKKQHSSNNHHHHHLQHQSSNSSHQLRSHSRDDSGCSGRSSSNNSEDIHSRSTIAGNSEEVVPPQICTSPLPNPPLSPIIKETSILDDDEEDDDDQQNNSLIVNKSDFVEAIAQFDFNARSPRELSLKKGETLVLYAQVSSDWWKGANRRGDEGLIPDKYIVLKIRDDDMSCTTTTPQQLQQQQSFVPPPSSATHHHQQQQPPLMIPPPLTTPPHHENASRDKRTRTASDSLITNPVVEKVEPNNSHQRSFSVSTDEKKINGAVVVLDDILVKKPIPVSAVQPVPPLEIPPPSTVSSPEAQVQQETSNSGEAITPQTPSPHSTTPPPAPQQQHNQAVQPSTSPQVKSNIQLWEQRLKPNLTPDLVMGLPTVQQGTTQPIQQQQPPIPPKFTDTSSSSEEDSDSSESSSPSTPTRVGSNAEVFAKQKNATLKKRVNEDIVVGNPGGSWGSGGTAPPTMFTFSSNNKPQVKVKPVVLSKPKLPREFVVEEDTTKEEKEEQDK